MDRVMPSVSIVIPAHNEQPTIERVVRSSAAAIPGAEVIVVDDGSTDGTHEAAADAGARVIRLDPNQGKGAALRRGIAAAKGDILVFIDGDGQDSPFEIPLLVGAFEPDVDLVLGSRFLGNFRPGAITQKNLAIQPTIKIRPGFSVNVIVTKDIVLVPYVGVSPYRR